jgi:hypothetical protein
MADTRLSFFLMHFSFCPNEGFGLGVVGSDVRIDGLAELSWRCKVAPRNAAPERVEN